MDLKDLRNYLLKKGDQLEDLARRRMPVIVGKMAVSHFKNNFRKRKEPSDEQRKLYPRRFCRVNQKRKCPDLKIDELFYEYESFNPPFKKRKIANMISHGAKQSSRIIINNSKGASDRFIRRSVYDRLTDSNFVYDIDELWLYEKGELRLLFKKQ